MKLDIYVFDWGDNVETTSIIPAIRVIKENSTSGCNMVITFGDNIRITDIKGRNFSGIFLCMDLAKNEEGYDSIKLAIGNEEINILCCNIKI